MGLILVRPLLVRCRSPKEHGEVVAVSTNVQIPDKKSAHLLIVDEQLFQPDAYVGVTLYLHFHVLNP